MKIKGIKRGQTIELLKELAIPDGSEITVEVPDAQLISKAERWERLNAVIGAWKDDPEITEIFAEMDRERHADLGRPVEFDDLD